MQLLTGEYGRELFPFSFGNLQSYGMWYGSADSYVQELPTTIGHGRFKPLIPLSVSLELSDIFNDLFSDGLKYEFLTDLINSLLSCMMAFNYAEWSIQDAARLLVIGFGNTSTTDIDTENVCYGINTSTADRFGMSLLKERSEYRTDIIIYPRSICYHEGSALHAPIESLPLNVLIARLRNIVTIKPNSKFRMDGGVFDNIVQSVKKKYHLVDSSWEYDPYLVISRIVVNSFAKEESRLSVSPIPEAYRDQITIGEINSIYCMANEKLSEYMRRNKSQMPYADLLVRNKIGLRCQQCGRSHAVYRFTNSRSRFEEVTGHTTDKIGHETDYYLHGYLNITYDVCSGDTRILNTDNTTRNGAILFFIPPDIEGFSQCNGSANLGCGVLQNYYTTFLTSKLVGVLNFLLLNKVDITLLPVECQYNFAERTLGIIEDLAERIEQVYFNSINKNSTFNTYIYKLLVVLSKTDPVCLRQFLLYFAYMVSNLSLGKVKKAKKDNTAPMIFSKNRMYCPFCCTQMSVVELD